MDDLFSRADLAERAESLFSELDAMPLEDRVEAINAIRLALHRHSPFQGEPVDCVVWVRADEVKANDYNPNAVAPPEMRLLERSIRMDGYTQPIVAHHGPGQYTIVDGFHRNRVGRESKAVRNRLHGYLPLTLINHGRAGRKDRIAATIRHNRGRGVHCVLPMTNIVAALIQEGWSDEDVAAELGMDADEVLRFKQNSGQASLFLNHPYSKAWE